jgi:hypothetical protein
MSSALSSSIRLLKALPLSRQQGIPAHRVRGIEGSVCRIANELVYDFIGDGRVELIRQFAIGLT